MPIFVSVKRFALLVSACALIALASAGEAHAEFSFQTTTLEPAGFVEDVAVGDVDGVNGPDIVTAYSEGGIGVQLNDGHGHFGPTHMYATGCDTKQVELADVGAPPSSIFPDGHLDAVISCSSNGGDTIELGRMFGDGSGGFSAPVMFPESGYGFANGLALSHQGFALVEFRGPGGPPVPFWTYLYQEGLSYHRVLCFSYDWSTRQCTNAGEAPEPYIPLVAGRVAEAELFTYGGTEGLLDWGPNPFWHASTRDFGPEPSSRDPADIWRSITIGDLGSDGPDILTSAGTSGAVLEEPASGRVSVLYGNTAEGVLPQHATTFPSAPGVEGIATGDFDLDGHTDVVGTYYHVNGVVPISGVFFQPGNGAGQLGAPQELPLSTSERFNYLPPQVADLDGNGTPDVVAIVGGKVQVLLNQKVRPPVINPIVAPGGGKLLKALEGIKNLPGSTKALTGGTLVLGTATNPPTASVGLTLTIPAKGKAKGSALTFARTKAKGKGTKKSKPVVLGTAQIKVPAGKTVPLKLKLDAKGRALLDKGPLHATLTVVATSTAGGKETKTQKLTVQAPSAKKKGKQK
jgi:hypothetical protein